MGNKVVTNVEMRVPAPVTLNVYDLGTGGKMQALNSVLSNIGTGAFHCGVEVYGREFSFQYISKGTGMFECQPKQCSQHTFRESVDMGTTLLSEAEVCELIHHMRKEWPGKSYVLLTRNCCHSCEEICLRLGVGSIPWWTTSLAATGATMKDLYNGVTVALNPTLLLSCMGRDASTNDKKPALAP